METVVEKIHAEFNTASDELLKEAKAVLEKESKRDIRGAWLLRLLGFKQAAQVRERKEQHERVAMALSTAKKVQRFSGSRMKFITPEKVREICRKYDLFLGPVRRFKGFIPPESAREIATLMFRPGYWMKRIAFRLVYHWQAFVAYAIIGVAVGGLVATFLVNPRWLFAIPAGLLAVPAWWSYSENDRAASRRLLRDHPLVIVAPQNAFDTDGLETDRYSHSLRVAPKDPIVLYRVRGGYLVVTAWGPEAEEVK